MNIRKISFLIALTVFFTSENSQAQLTFEQKVIDANVQTAVGLSIADLNGDNRLDIIGAPGTGPLKWYENTGQQTFISQTTGFSLVDTEEDCVFSCDLDRDGDMDMVCAERQADKVVWLENNGQGSFSRRVIDATMNAPWSIYATDLDNDDDVDVLCAANFSSEVAWFENTGNQSFIKHSLIQNFDYATCVFAADMDGDSDVDIIAGAAFGIFGQQEGLIWWENNNNSFANQHIIDAEIDLESVYIFDADQDGDADVVGAAFSQNKLILWKNNGNQQFVPHNIAQNYSGADSVVAVDLDGDNDLDILAAGYWQGALDYWENDGNGNFTIRSVSTNYSGTAKVHAADMDADGDMDLITASSLEDNISIWFNQAIQVSSKEIQTNDLLVIAPNPASDYIGLNFKNDQFNNHQLQVFAPSGSLVFTIKTTQKHTTVPRNNLPSGAYGWVLQDPHGNPIESGVLIFE